jgi:FixJ family two-component response regulator
MQARPGVFVVEDDEAARTALLRLISAVGHPSFGFATASEFLQSDCFDQPGCLVLDFSLPDMSGIELVQELNNRNCMLPVIFMSGYGDIPLTVRAMKLGAVDFLAKPVRESVLFATIDNALAVAEIRRGKRASDDGVRVRLESLTPREREVLNGVLSGRLNKQIARELGISEKTVKVHRGRVMAKMGVRHVAQLVQLADQIDYHVSASRQPAVPRILTVPAWRRRTREESEIATSAV